ncbi:hypothetical protein K503DRAFT_805703 [Rhizopogon vinicolor AM-OR11-026]|uniref:Uncharacterized protein n=1 Tax=Rhizopogon vinicolor AM-OR11-026 TaxID=1314800 RepID=A0A1B7MGZ8_9AGAM|nr:hypothetical protein K503DRAFT_805703 [Rhizopogon vinicolor AM-OR11-026]
MYAAEFTTNADKHYCEYANCLSGDAGTVLAVTYIEHKDPRKQGKWLCERCSQYQHSKLTTRKISDIAVIPNTSQHGFACQSEYDHDGAAKVHKQTAEAQHGKSQLAVRAVGFPVQSSQYMALEISGSRGSGDIVESISNVPYCIGGNDLKTSVYLTLLPMFIEWSKGLAFTFEEACLHLASNFEEIIPHPSGEDINAIASHFLKTRSGKQQFNAGKGIELHLLIPHAKFLAAEERRDSEELVESQAHDSTSNIVTASTSRHCVSKPTSSSNNVQILPQPSPQPAKRKHSLPPLPSTPPQKHQTLDITVSPDVSKLHRALQAQAIPLSGPKPYHKWAPPPKVANAPIGGGEGPTYDKIFS